MVDSGLRIYGCLSDRADYLDCQYDFPENCFHCKEVVERDGDRIRKKVYALDKPGVITVLPGVRNREELREALGYFSAA